MPAETFGQVVHRGRDGGDGGERDEEGSEREDHVVQMLLQGNAEDTEADGHDDKGGDPEGVEAVFGLPVASRAATEIERDGVVEEVAPKLGCEDAKPEGECDCAWG